MALDLSSFFAAAQSEQDRFKQFIRGLENLSKDHMDADEAAQILHLFEIYKHLLHATTLIINGIDQLKTLSYPKDPTLSVSPAFKEKIEAELSATEAADTLIIVAHPAVNGPLLFQPPLAKP